MSNIETRLTAALAGRYAIERELGEGGMATVYLARDVRHNRSVAIKVLKPELAAVVGAERFLAEIETTANLQHPHILPLFDSGEADGFLFYVMPYVEGETLRDRIDREGQLPVDEAVGMASSIANALQTAHEQGIVHRDIKPANILLSRGEPLVADFGIALAVHAGGSGRMTETGLSLGTPYYMSPEQATGDQEVGPAADIYALGSVLYEMLIGEPPYPGNSAQAVLGRILQGAPPSATAVRRSIPLNVDGAILKALEKLPADRFATARDFANALSNPAFRYGPGAEAAASGGGRGWAAVAGVLGVTTLLFGAIAAWGLGRDPAPDTVTRLALDLPEAVPTSTRLPETFRLALSPDGRRLIFVGPGSGFNTQLWVRDFDQLDPRPIPGTEGASNASFSPDGLDVAFVTNRSGRRELRRVPLNGGPTLLLSDSLIDGGGISWGPDGWIYIDARLAGDGFARVPETGGPPEPMTQPAPDEAWHSVPFALPNGRGVIFYMGGTGEIAVLDLETGDHRTLVSGLWAGYVESGHLLWVTADGALMTQPFDAGALELSGRPVPLAEGLVRPASWGGASVTISGNGDIAYLAGQAQELQTTMVWVDRTGAVVPVDTAWVRDFNAFEVSPDGSQYAVSIQEGDDSDIWVRSVDGGPPRKLTFDGASDEPAWLPDSEWVGYVADGAIWRRRADGSGVPVRVAEADRRPRYLHWTRDGRWLLYNDQDAIYLQELDPEGIAAGERRVLIDDLDGGFEGQATVSPDGRWVAFVLVAGNRPRTYVRPFPDTEQGNWLITESEAAAAMWSADGSQLIFRDATSDALHAVTLLPGESFAHTTPERLFDLDGLSLPRLDRGWVTALPGADRFLMLQIPGSTVDQKLIWIQNAGRLLQDLAGN
jgi:serine/threonine-protein kinase